MGNKTKWVARSQERFWCILSPVESTISGTFNVSPSAKVIMQKSSSLRLASPWLYLLCIALLAALLRSPVARAEIAAAKNASAYTYHDYCIDEVDFYRRALVDTYKAIGQKHSKWDGEALDFLEKALKHLAYFGKPKIYHPQGLPTADELEKAGAALVKKGCADPQVL